jgi:hypothetical protein
MLGYGAVIGTARYAKQHQARWRARYLMQRIVDLELARRVSNYAAMLMRDGGLWWVVEYFPPPRYVRNQRAQAVPLGADMQLEPGPPLLHGIQAGAGHSTAGA